MVALRGIEALFASFTSDTDHITENLSYAVLIKNKSVLPCLRCGVCSVWKMKWLEQCHRKAWLHANKIFANESLNFWKWARVKRFWGTRPPYDVIPNFHPECVAMYELDAYRVKCERNIIRRSGRIVCAGSADEEQEREVWGVYVCVC